MTYAKLIGLFRPLRVERAVSWDEADDGPSLLVVLRLERLRDVQRALVRLETSTPRPLYG